MHNSIDQQLIIVQVFYNPFENPENPFGSAESVYDFISCWRAPGGDMGNIRESYLTFFSPGTVGGVAPIVRLTVGEYCSHDL
jgi:hypothetical protein